jgi:hypothetical protein
LIKRYFLEAITLPNTSKASTSVFYLDLNEQVLVLKRCKEAIRRCQQVADHIKSNEDVPKEKSAALKKQL